MVPKEDDDQVQYWQFSNIPYAWMIVEAAVGFSKTFGPEVCHHERSGQSTYGLTYLTENTDPRRS